MNLSTIEMPKDEARKAFLEYRGAVRERHNSEDAAIMRGYRALADGRQLIRLSDTIRAAGQDERMRPRFAVIHADAPEVLMTRDRDGNVRYGRQRWDHDRREIGANHLTIRTVMPRVPGSISWDEWTKDLAGGDWRAITPNIPPRFRPAGNLNRYHILWEAEWARPTRPRRAPADPALIRHLEGDLWVVLAVWDLTPLEQAVILGRQT